MQKLLQSQYENEKSNHIDNGHVEYGVSAELLCQVLDINKDIKIDSMPVRMGFPAYPTPNFQKLAENTTIQQQGRLS